MAARIKICTRVLPELRVLLVHGAMSNGKDQQIHEDQRQGDDRPASGRHILVLDWDKHGAPQA